MDSPDKYAMKLLIVEDDSGLQSQLRWCFDGYEVLLAEDRSSAMTQVRRHQPQLVTLDLGLPPDPANATEGLALLEEILATTPETKVIVVTGNDDRANALKAVSLGAYDFYIKPVDAEALRLIVDRAAHLFELEAENRKLARESASPLQGLITSDPGMLKICRMIERVAPSDATVLLLGESGTGKEVLARALHQLSPRSKGPFVAINCAAIPENLLESELFGYEKGAFTGATRQTIGKIEHADKGTLFLDEIGDLPMSLQAKLLRFLQERVVERLGGRTEIPVDIRIVGATNKDLEALIKSGDFREDLFYRISEIAIHIPPLRERQGDRSLIAHALLERFRQDQRRTNRLGFSTEALRAIEAYDWPGNVREMENLIRRAVIMADGPLLEPDDLGLAASSDSQDHIGLREIRDAAEQEAIIKAMGRCNGNIAQAADLLGITRPTLYNLLDKYGFRQ
ncbi:PEP-CTERM-box response regulator transcription factor [Halochromatium glycolicum]|uniref:PEP-CTERM-box response regulator transcription factor n=2 Tax=Halochromatium glycolicum TaxID=85075 RepID=A0AAJ0XAC4_9GAMM|nr:PEP-CTERM-box response regulator transcription factor [Halochromatium glycolicum]MBK1704662.1 PEP-CTERM-box response regulator transcription factor [Halochromatium glycolicum]